jgi:hypothetical protein
MAKIKTKKPLVKVQKRRPKTSRHLIRFVPALVLLIAAFSVAYQPPLRAKHAPTDKTGVLAFATNMNSGDLLAATNSERSGNGVGTLTQNSMLVAAAQAKANDMISRNYWSHVTPDGTQPWAFITNAGYQYSTAGENLAYGFMTGSEAVTGWMNSPPHRANILNGSFTEVGFGIANGENFNNDGQQTVVVAMYAAPQYTPPAPAVAQQSNNPPATTQTAPAAEQTAPTTDENAPADTQTAQEAKKTATVQKQAVATVNGAETAQSTQRSVRKIQLFTGGQAAWSATAVMATISSIGILYAIQRGLHIRRLIVAGERFFVHHIHLDLAVGGLVLLGIALMSTSGIIR